MMLTLLFSLLHSYIYRCIGITREFLCILKLLIQVRSIATGISPG